MATQCPTCGTPVTGGVRFCSHCGADVRHLQEHVATAEAGAFTPDPLLERLRAATLGEYEVQGELGRGGMAVVYLAHDIALDRKVAIKVMLPELVTGRGAVERFRREARTAGGLSHPHIIPIYAVREANGLVFFVMKFVEGRGLDSIIAELGPLPIPMIQAVLTQVAGTLAHAHRKNVIHRDIKPANVMIDEDGWAVVTDFGVAKVEGGSALTSTGAAVGTPLYMSPEQCSGKPVTGATDQYSLGIMAYEMLTGDTPFGGATVMEVMGGHFFTPPPPVLAKRPDCPPALAAVVMRMLAKEPNNRFPSLEDVTAAIGVPQAGQSDAVREQLRSLARSREQRLPHLGVPTSPLITRTMRRTQRSTIRPLVIAAGGIVLVGVLAWALRARFVTRGAAPITADSSAAVVNPPPAPAVTAPRDTAPPHTRPARERVQPPSRGGAPPKAATTDSGALLIGTRVPGVFYVNGVAAGSLSGLAVLRVPAGAVRIAVAADGCTRWDSTVNIKRQDTLRLGYRSPTCAH